VRPHPLRDWATAPQRPIAEGVWPHPLVQPVCVFGGDELGGRLEHRASAEQVTARDFPFDRDAVFCPVLSS
jgi:hypothetical protein